MSTPTIIEKWAVHIEDDDIFIYQVQLKQTPKLWTLVKQPHGDGKNTAIGFGGTRISKTVALGYQSRFNRGGSRFYDTYEEAREALHKKLLERLASAKRRLDQAADLLDLFTGVHYEKQD